MTTITFDKSKRNLKKVYNRLKYSSPAKALNSNQVLFLAVGGYNRTFGLLRAMGLNAYDIAVFNHLKVDTLNYIKQTHLKKVLYINKLNFITDRKYGQNFYDEGFSLEKAHELEESMLLYQKANRTFMKKGDEVQWIKPDVVILDDPALNLQTGGYRFSFQKNLGFVQMKDRNIDPLKVLEDIKDVEPAEHMHFALYQTLEVNEEKIIASLGKLRQTNEKQSDDKADYFKPTLFKSILGSELAENIKAVEELKITQFDKNRRIGGQQARWIIVPHEAYDFQGFVFKDEEQLEAEEIRREMELEEQAEQEMKDQLAKTMTRPLNLNFKLGWQGQKVATDKETYTLEEFLATVDEVNEEIESVQKLQEAETQDDYQNIKAHDLWYFIDGSYEDNIRRDDHYQGKKQLVALDVDEGEYTRDQIEDMLEAEGLFGMVYPTAKHYYDGSKRWRMVMLADQEMDKQSYKNVVEGLSRSMGLEADSASKKISQLMGCPLVEKDVSLVPGTTIKADRYKKEKPTEVKILNFGSQPKTKKSLLDFNHHQSALLRQAVEGGGFAEGKRNSSYHQIKLYLLDTLENPDFENQWEEAEYYLSKLPDYMTRDGLEEKEIETICRPE